MIRSKTRKKAAWFTRNMAAEFMSMLRWPSTANCRMEYRAHTVGVPGAYRLFANLLSLPRNPALKQRESAAASQK
jgi:hypothetical protein